MDCNRTRRGRPKGSGIDDSGRLREIAAMIVEDPQLKPTTAIKNTGICDPSTIRRLRDKFNIEKDELFHELQTQDHLERQYSGRNKSNPQSSQGPYENRTIALNHKREPARRQPVADKTETGTASPDSGEAPGQPRQNQHSMPCRDPDMHGMLSESLRATSAMWQLQLVMTTQFFQSPVVRSALRYQLAFSQTLFGFGGLQPAIRAEQS